MKLSEVLELIVEYLKTTMRDYTTNIESHPGEFSESELNKTLVRGPAIRVSIARVSDLVVGGEGLRDITIQVNAFVITSDADQKSRHASALDITNEIIEMLVFERFGSNHVMPVMPTTISAENLYSGELNKKGVTIWGITWQQRIKQ